MCTPLSSFHVIDVMRLNVCTCMKCHISGKIGGSKFCRMKENCFGEYNFDVPSFGAHVLCPAFILAHQKLALLPNSPNFIPSNIFHYAVRVCSLWKLWEFKLSLLCWTKCLLIWATVLKGLLTFFLLTYNKINVVCSWCLRTANSGFDKHIQWGS